MKYRKYKRFFRVGDCGICDHVRSHGIGVCLGRKERMSTALHGEESGRQQSSVSSVRCLLPGGEEGAQIWTVCFLDLKCSTSNHYREERN